MSNDFLEELGKVDFELSVWEVVKNYLPGEPDWLRWNEEDLKKHSDLVVEYLETKIDHYKKVLTLWTQVLMFIMVSISVIFMAIQDQITPGTFPVFKAVMEYGRFISVFFIILVSGGFASLVFIAYYWIKYKAVHKQKIRIKVLKEKDQK